AVGGFYLLGARGAAGGGLGTLDVARAFAHSLVPIAFAYAAAHYVSLLILQSQAVAPLVSDPLGEGWNLLGTATWSVNYTLVGAETFWYIQVALVVAGHMAALTLAHDRALVVFGTVKQAVRSQGWMLAVMIGYTTFALWLLSQANEG
ncbi:MAG TPA: fenitrothion hydrolase, partial [Solirubrobacteraceae bacterium]|nr:fenitrothion hydrolase [Solirubrobacteraceae bacterium]